MRDGAWKIAQLSFFFVRRRGANFSDDSPSVAQNPRLLHDGPRGVARLGRGSTCSVAMKLHPLPRVLLLGGAGAHPHAALPVGRAGGAARGARHAGEVDGDPANAAGHWRDERSRVDRVDRVDQVDRFDSIGSGFDLFADVWCIETRCQHRSTRVVSHRARERPSRSASCVSRSAARSTRPSALGGGGVRRVPSTSHARTVWSSDPVTSEQSQLAHLARKRVLSRVSGTFAANHVVYRFGPRHFISEKRSRPSHHSRA